MSRNKILIQKDFIDIVEGMIIKANFDLTPEVKRALEDKLASETSPLGKQVLQDIIINSEIAAKQRKPLCQDSGVSVFFVEIGYLCHLDFNIEKAINIAVGQAHTKAFLRGSMVKGPFERINSKNNTPAIVHIKIVDGDKIKIEYSAKGAGSENMSTMKIFRPTVPLSVIKQYVVDTIFHSGGRPCPPITIGLGIGGNFETCTILAKKALFVPLDEHNSDPKIKQLEIELYDEVNHLGIGAMGLGGKATCIGVKILTAPCHIASLPVAININCHSSRHIKVII